MKKKILQTNTLNHTNEKAVEINRRKTTIIKEIGNYNNKGFDDFITSEELVQDMIGGDSEEDIPTIDKHITSEIFFVKPDDFKLFSILQMINMEKYFENFSSQHINIDDITKLKNKDIEKLIPNKRDMKLFTRRIVKYIEFWF